MIGNGANGEAHGTAIGSSANGYNYGSAMGRSANGYDSGSAMGYYALGYDSGAAMGSYANGSNNGSAMGSYANGSNNASVMGRNANGHDSGAAMGYYATAYNSGVAMGSCANGYSYGIAIGRLSNANSDTSSTEAAPKIAIGYDTDNNQAGNTCLIRGNLYLNYSDGKIRYRNAYYGDFTTKDFIIDHPLDPENKILRHATIESPTVLNVYVGSVELDKDGESIVQLPDYFEALNINPKYQLTAVGQAMPDLHIKEKIHNNTFLISGGAPFGEVSWEIKGERNDLAMRDHPFIVEENKMIPGLLYSRDKK